MPLLPVRPELTLVSILAYSYAAFAIGLLITPSFFIFLKKHRLGKNLRTESVDGKQAQVFLQYHQAKAGTPTMGGVLIWGSILATVLLSRLLSLFGGVDHSLLQRGQVYLPLLTLASFGVIGGVDDYLNIIGTDEQRLKRFMPRAKALLAAGLAALAIGVLFSLIATPESAEILRRSLATPYGLLLAPAAAAIAVFLLMALGLSGAVAGDYLEQVLIRQSRHRGLGVLPKILSLLGISLIGALWFYTRLDYHTISIPFGGTIGLPSIDLGFWYVPFFLLVVIGTANAVNVTDGLDGLAGGLLMIAFGAFGIVAYVHGLMVLAGFCGVAVGAIAAFLWNNVPPALFFMGDTGSLALGGTLAVMAFMIDQVLLLPLIGFIFVLEMLSVIIQLLSKKYRGRKVFLSAPLHHHLEALGWGESKVTMRLWLIGMVFAFLGVLAGIYG